MAVENGVHKHISTKKRASCQASICSSKTLLQNSNKINVGSVKILLWISDNFQKIFFNNVNFEWLKNFLFL